MDRKPKLTSGPISAVRALFAGQQRRLYTHLPVIGIIGTLALLALVGAESYLGAHRMANTMAKVDETREIIANLEEISLDVESSVSIVRVFVLVGNEAILEPLEQIERDIVNDLAMLKEAFAGNPEQLAKLQKLGDLVTRRLNQANEYVELRRVKGLQETVDSIPAGGEALSAAIRAQIAEIKQLEQERLKQRKTDASKSSARALTAMMLTGAGSLVSLVVGFAALRRQISSRREAEQALRESEERYSTTVKLAGIGICHVAPDGRFLWANQRLGDMLGYSTEEMIGLSTRDVTHPDDYGVTEGAKEQMTTGEIDSFKVEKRYLRRDGETIWVRVTVTTKRNADGSPLYNVSMIDDISNRKRTEARVKYLASHDEMTGLPNRVTFGELLKRAIKTARRHNRQCAVLFIDLDRFKDINDTLGHRAGDQLLQAVSRRLQAALRDTDTAARLGGDEFCVLAEDIDDSTAAGIVAEKCLRAIGEPITIAGRELEPRASIGITLFPEDGEDHEALLQNADSAMYAAKQLASHQFAFYTPQLTVDAERRLTLEHDLRKSVQSGAFTLHYQPLIDLSSGRLVSLEALVRWNHPKRGIVAPDEFIGVAEKIGVIDDLGEWVLRTACHEAVRWSKSLTDPVRVSVNISSQHFTGGRLTQAVAATLEETGLNAGLLELEITESAIQTKDETVSTLTKLRELGVRVAIDDFGTGYAWLDSLRQLPVDSLKVDRRFILDLFESESNAAILATIVAMARAMQLSVVAEGVETLEHVQYLQALGCDMAQGFFFSEPVRAEEVPELLTRNFRPATDPGRVVELSERNASRPSLRMR